MFSQSDQGLGFPDDEALGPLLSIPGHRKISG